TAGVDIEIRRSMWAFIEHINQDGTTVILTTHYLEEAENLCNHIAIIDEGVIVENTSVKDLLSKLDVETFVLDLATEVHNAPSVEGMKIELRDPTTLIASLPKSSNLNALFRTLERESIVVRSMRNKANRLEELFLRLVDKSSAASDAVEGREP
ncbi:MAG: ABC transporter ATP-binding protein, partial [Pseudomonadota bacterium]